MSCQESVCTYTYLSTPTQLLAPFLSQVKQAQPNAGRLWGCAWGSAALPCAQGGFTTHIPLPWVPSSATAPDPFPPRCRSAGAPAPCLNGSWFSRSRGNHLTAPSRHQMVPINFVYAQLASVNGKAQTPNILLMKQQRALCQRHRTGSQPLLHTAPATGGKQAKSRLGIWVRDLLHLGKGQAALQLSNLQPSR